MFNPNEYIWNERILDIYPVGELCVVLLCVVSRH